MDGCGGRAATAAAYADAAVASHGHGAKVRLRGGGEQLRCCEGRSSSAGGMKGRGAAGASGSIRRRAGGGRAATAYADAAVHGAKVRLRGGGERLRCTRCGWLFASSPDGSSVGPNRARQFRWLDARASYFMNSSWTGGINFDIAVRLLLWAISAFFPSTLNISTQMPNPALRGSKPSLKQDFAIRWIAAMERRRFSLEIPMNLGSISMGSCEVANDMAAATRLPICAHLKGSSLSGRHTRPDKSATCDIARNTRFALEQQWLGYCQATQSMSIYL